MTRFQINVTVAIPDHRAHAVDCDSMELGLTYLLENDPTWGHFFTVENVLALPLPDALVEDEEGPIWEYDDGA